MSARQPDDMIPEGAPRRVRITARTGLDQVRRVFPDPVDPRAVYVRSLMRSQLRLALLCLGGFLGLLALGTIGIRVFPELTSTRLWGVPLSWWLLGFGPYPLIIVTGGIYARAARRNESAYRGLSDALQDDE